MQSETVTEFARRKHLDVTRLGKLLEIARQKLLSEREKRHHPGLDDKALCSWNALMIKALAGLYTASGDELYLSSAIRAARLMLSNFIKEDGGLVRSYKNGPSEIDGFLEDYAFLVDALTELYQVTFDEFWLAEAEKLTDFSIRNFYDESDGFFWFTSNQSHNLVARKKEIHDNVIPSSNSTMASVLFKLGRIFENDMYSKIAEKMLKRVSTGITKYPSAYSNWGILLIYWTGDFYDVAITGEDVLSVRLELAEHYFPSKIILGTSEKSDLPLLRNRFIPGKTMIYVCTNRECKKPTEKVNEAIELLEGN